MEKRTGETIKGEQGEISRHARLFHFSMSELLTATTVVAVAAGVAVAFPTIAVLSTFGWILIAMHFPELFMRYLPRTTLLSFAGVGAAFIGRAIFDGLKSGSVDELFSGKIILGSLFFLLTGISYFMIQPRKG
jgi:hypothetical protein